MPYPKERIYFIHSLNNYFKLAMERSSHPINSFAESFFRRRKSVIAFLLWFVMLNICFYLEMSNSSKSTFLFGNFSSPLSSLAVISQRFFFYFYWIGSTFFLAAMLTNFISIFGNKTMDKTESSNEPTGQDNRTARNFLFTTVSLKIINIVFFFSIAFVIPSEKSAGQVFRGVLEAFVN